jgi:hypothetical protein
MSACALLGLPSSPESCKGTACTAAAHLLTWACDTVLTKPSVESSFGVGAHAAVRAALQVVTETAQRAASAANALADKPGGTTLEDIASKWVAEAAALRVDEGVLCWPVGSASGAAVFMLERESDNSFAVTFFGGEGVEYHPQVSFDFFLQRAMVVGTSLLSTFESRTPPDMSRR